MKQLISPYRTTFGRDLAESIGIGLVLTALSDVVGIAFGWLATSALNWLEGVRVDRVCSWTWRFLITVEECLSVRHQIFRVSRSVFGSIIDQLGPFCSDQSRTP